MLTLLQEKKSAQQSASSFVVVCKSLNTYATSLSWHGVCTMHCTVLCICNMFLMSAQQ